MFIERISEAAREIVNEIESVLLKRTMKQINKICLLGNLLKDGCDNASSLKTAPEKNRASP